MGFKPLSEYSKGNLPKVYSYNNYTICENIESYKPFDVSGLPDVIKNNETIMQTDLDDGQRSIMENINSLSTEWGTKYISIDGKDLKIVNCDFCSEKVNAIVQKADNQIEEINAIISDIVNLTESANEYVDKIINNNKEYKNKLKEKNDLIQSYNETIREIENENAKENPNTGKINALNERINDLSIKINDLDYLIDIYETNRIDEPEGSWIIGS